MALELSPALRRLVFTRAKGQCEYCLLPQSIALHAHEPDHIIPIQHGGETQAENLALACMRCNRYKGPNVGSIDPETGKLSPFFNPRVQDWREHFALDQGLIRPLTTEGRVTVRIFRFNDSERLVERERLIEVGLYPQTI